MSEFCVLGHSIFRGGLTKKSPMTAEKKGTGTRFLTCGRLADPKIKLGTEILSWERFNALNS